ncbi:type II secretion system secretin GspD [Inmirania thermothiophila]|nr:type II secretion system secretin GspD [Inmirania thermothiophila]
MRMALAGLVALLAGTVSAAPVTLNLQDADIGALVRTVAEATGRNFIVDPRVKGKVTVISARPMEGEDLYRVFLSILAVHGFAAVEQGEVVKIVPDADARAEPLPVDGDGGGGDRLVTRVIALRHVPATQLVPVLRPLVGRQSHLAAYPPANVLIVTDRAANIARLEAIIERVDVPSEQTVEVVRLAHADAPELARVLAALVRSQGKEAAPVQVVADERTNSLLLSGPQGERLRLRALVAHLDTPPEEGGTTQVIYLRYAKAADLVPVLTGLAAAPAAAGKGEAQGGAVRIQAHEATNALVVSAPPAVLREIEQVVRRLDIRRAQVLVEAAVAEVAADRARELGVQWLADGSPNQRGGVGLVNFNIAGSAITGLLEQPPRIGEGLSLGLGDLSPGGDRFALLLRALAADAATNVLSTPTLVTMDNQQAEIVVAQNVPFVTGQFVSTTSNSTPQNPFQTIQRRDVGLILRVTPQINEGTAIRLEIEQEVSSVSPSSQGAVDLVTNRRAIKTSVMVDDGEVLVLGGLLDDTLQESEQRVPGLGDIPGLGWLFRYRKVSKVKRNLMVFLHPTILRDADMARRVTGGKYRALRRVQQRFAEGAAARLPGAEPAVLPPMEELLRLPPPFEEAAPPPPAEPGADGRR